MFEVKYIETIWEHDYKRCVHEAYLTVGSYFKEGGLYYFRINEFNYIVIAEEDILYIVEL